MLANLFWLIPHLNALFPCASRNRNRLCSRTRRQAYCRYRPQRLPRRSESTRAGRQLSRHQTRTHCGASTRLNHRVLSGNPAKELDKLRKLGFEIYNSKTGTFEDIVHNLEQLSQYAEDPSVGMKAAADFRENLAQLKQRYTTDKPVKYFYQLSTKPIITVAQNSW